MGRVIKILHVGLSDNIGGIETVVRSWHKQIPKDITFDFINNNEGTLAFEKEFRDSGSRIFKIPSRKSNYRESNRLIKQIIGENHYDYLHFHAMSLSWPDPILIALKTGETQAIIHSHTVLDHNISLKYKVLHNIGKIRLKKYNYHKLACGNDAGRNMFGSDDYIVIANGIELDKFVFSTLKRETIRKKYNIPSNAYVIGHVGRPGPIKNYPFIFQCFNKIASVYSNMFLLLIGNIEKDSEIQMLINKWNCRDKVIFAGFQNDCSDFYSAMDMFFFPSLFEGFSVSLIEAQASGVPCIVGNVAKETKMSNYFSFVNIDSEEEALYTMQKYMKMNINRNNITISEKYDVKNTSNMLFDFYRQHQNK